MARKVFYSFHYVPDNQRVSQVRQMGVLAGNALLSANKWEEVTSGRDKAIKKWIAEEMSGKTCLVVLAGRNTAGRKWVNYEIVKAWNDGLGVVGIHVHNLKSLDGKVVGKGSNPLSSVSLGSTKKLSSVAMTYDPPGATSTKVYDHISKNLADWVEEAIDIRAKYKG
ncbi:MAG: hypothetical protein JWM93_2925 [Frankiales bacterium]|nr:hypothetical protein [Frankiales bacterium]